MGLIKRKPRGQAGPGVIPLQSRRENSSKGCAQATDKASKCDRAAQTLQKHYDPAVAERTAHVTDAPTYDGYTFAENFFLYSHCHREALLNLFVRHFLQRANTTELSAVREAVRNRAASFRKKSKKGRPNGHSPAWLSQSLRQARQKYVLGWSFTKIAREAGQHVDKANQKQIAWTLKRRLLTLAAWLLPRIPQPPEGLQTALENSYVLANLSNLIGFPRTECRIIALGLADADQSLIWFPGAMPKRA